MTGNKMGQYCKLPIPITAYQTDKEMDIETLEGTHHASVGDWIITGVNGEQYPCKPDIFAKTYIKYGQANKMEIIAALFGKKLGEEFIVQKEYSITPCYAMFTANGLAITDGNGYLLTGMDIDLMGYTVNTEDLLTARAVIVDD